MEDSLSLDELVALYEATIERQNRMIKTIAMAMGAEFEDEAPTHTRPAHLIDPKQGGAATPVYGDKEASQLPFNIGYEIIE